MGAELSSDPGLTQAEKHRVNILSVCPDPVTQKPKKRLCYVVTSLTISSPSERIRFQSPGLDTFAQIIFYVYVLDLGASLTGVN